MVDRTTDAADDMDLDLTSDLHDEGVQSPNGGDVQQADHDTDDIRENNLKAKPKAEDLSLRDQLSSAFKVTSDEGADKKDTPTDANATHTDGDKPAAPAPALTQDAEGRWRKIDGTFASTEEVEAMQAASTSAAPNYDELIATLPANVAEQVKSLPAETQQFVARTMEDLNGRAQRYAEYDQLEQILGPRRELWAQNGTNSVVALNQLLTMSDFAGRDPAQFVMWFAEQNNIDLDAELDARDAAGRASPEVQQLRNQVNELSQRLEQQGNRPQTVQDDARNQTVNMFASEKDEGGNLKRPYLPQVMNEFPSHVLAVRQANPSMSDVDVLSKAYEAACWANPQVRTEMQKEVDAQRIAAARQKVAAKKAASSSVRGAPNGGSGVSHGQSNNGKQSLRETLQQAFAAHG